MHAPLPPPPPTRTTHAYNQLHPPPHTPPHTSTPQEHIYYGRISDDEPLLPSIMDLVTSVRRWNPQVLGTGDDGGSADDGAKKVRRGTAGPGGRRGWRGVDQCGCVVERH